MTREQMKSHFVVHTNGQDEWIKVDKRIYDKAIDMFCAAHDAELKAKDERIETQKQAISFLESRIGNRSCENCNPARMGVENRDCQNCFWHPDSGLYDHFIPR